MTSPPAVRIVPGPGIALRTAGIVAWLAPAPNHPGAPEVDLGGIIRELVVAAGRAPGSVPVQALTGLIERHPWLTLAVVALEARQGTVWTSGDADVLIEGEGRGRVVDGQVGRALSETFALPVRAVRLGDPHSVAGWSHLVEGAVPAGGVSVLWPDEDPGRAAPATAPEPRFQAVSLLDPEPVDAPRPLPTAESADLGEEVVVPGLLCSRGHFNHPLAANCAWCGIGMIQVSHVLVRRPRPALGVLVVDGQTTYTLDADYVIGRQPNRRPEVDGEQVRAIVLASDPSISREHAAIRLREWEVFAEDLHSARGTWLQQPGQQPTRLPPGQPVELRPGTVLYVGAHRLTYHSHHLR